MTPQKGTYLFTYDIKDPRRLRKVHDRLKKPGLAIQYSVFLIDGHRQMQDTFNQIADIVEDEDDVRVYYRIKGHQSLWLNGSLTPNPQSTNSPKPSPCIFSALFDSSKVADYQ